MLKLVSTGKPIGTPVRCPACRYPNLAIDIWCERCGRPLDWKQTEAAPSEAAPLTPVGEAAPAVTPTAYCPSCGAPNLPTDKYCPRCGSPMSRQPQDPSRPPSRRTRRRRGFRLPRISLPALTLPRVSMARQRLPRVRAIVLIVAAGVAVLLIVPLTYALQPFGHPVAAQQNAASSPQAAATTGVEAKTGLRFTAKCSANAACLSVVSQTVGKDAAVVVFSTANSGGRQCAGYVFRRGGSWHVLDVVCGRPDQLTPLVGHHATVHVTGRCANVRNAASLRARVVGCIPNGTAVQIDGGPAYADGRLWWHEGTGWVAHDFLVGP